MRLVELRLEGGTGAPPSVHSLGAGHTVVRGGARLFSLLRAILFPEGSERVSFLEGEAALQVEIGGKLHEIACDFSDDHGWLIPSSFPLRNQRTFDELFFLKEEEGAGRREDPAALRRQLAALEAELVALEKMGALEGRVAELQHELFGARERLRRLREGEERVGAARDRLDAFEGRGVPWDVSAEVAAHEKALARKQEMEARLEKEWQGIGASVEAPVTLFSDRRAWYAAGAGLVLLAAAFFSPWRAVALLSLPPFGWGAFLLLGAITRMDREEKASRKRAFLEERKRKIEATWEAESGALREVLEHAGLADVEELKDWLAQRRQAKEALDDAEGALRSLHASPEVASAKAEEARISAEVEAAEGELALLVAGAFRSEGEVRQEAALARQRLRLAEGEEVQDPTEGLLDQAVACFGADRAALLEAVGRRASQILASLTEGAWSAMGWGASGGVACKGKKGVVGYERLADEERVLVRAAFAFAAAERSSGSGLGLLLLDRPFDGCSPQRQAILARLLSWLGKQGVHVLHRTDVSLFSTAADALAEAP